MSKKHGDAEWQTTSSLQSVYFTEQVNMSHDFDMQCFPSKKKRFVNCKIGSSTITLFSLLWGGACNIHVCTVDRLGS